MTIGQASMAFYLPNTHTHKYSEGAKKGLRPERHTPQIMPLTNQYKRQKRGWTHWF